MTTVLFDGTTLAADTKSTTRPDDGSVCDHCATPTSYHRPVAKIFVMKKGAQFRGEPLLLAGMSGTYSQAKRSIDFLNAGHDLEAFTAQMELISRGAEVKIPGHTLLLITESKRCFEVYFNGTSAKPAVTEHTKFPVAIGSGGPAAVMAYRLYPIDAIHATLLVEEVDPFTGGAIDFVRLKDGVRPKISRLAAEDVRTARAESLAIREALIADKPRRRVAAGSRRG